MGQQGCGLSWSPASAWSTGSSGAGTAPQSWSHLEARDQPFVSVSVTHWLWVGVRVHTHRHARMQAHTLGGGTIIA